MIGMFLSDFWYYVGCLFATQDPIIYYNSLGVQSIPKERGTKRGKIVKLMLLSLVTIVHKLSERPYGRTQY